LHSKQIDTLLISTIKESFIVKFTSATQVREIQQFSVLPLNTPTLAAGTTKRGYLLHVTALSVRMMTCQEQGVLIDEWKPPKGQSIAIAKMNETQCVLCYGRGTLVYLDCAGETLKELW
jgi:hypothetical protein